MKAVVINEFGAPEGLAVAEVPDPQPAVGEVQIAVEASGVGFQDSMIRSGKLSAMGFSKGHILGGEVSGTIVKIGEGVERSWIGKKVWSFLGLGGGYAELAVAPVDKLVELPDAFGPIDAVTVGSTGMVAHFALRHAQFKPGESVLVRGAAGPIGIMAVQLAARSGAGAIAVTTSSEKRGARLKALGATHVLDRSGAGASDAPVKYDIIIDIVGGADMGTFFSRLNPGGRLVMVGAVGGFPPANFAEGMIPLFQQSLSFATFSANLIAERERLSAIAGLFAAARGGEIKAIVHEKIPLIKATLAHQKLEASEAFGRLLLVPTRDE